MTQGRRRLLGWLIGVVVLVAAILVGVRFIDTDALVARALAGIETRTGYAVTVRDSEVRLGWSGVYLHLDGVHAVGPEAAREGDVGSVDALVALGPLLRKKLEVRELVAHGPVRYAQAGVPGVLEAEDFTATTSFAAGAASGGEGIATARLDRGVWIMTGGRFPVPATEVDLTYGWNAAGSEVSLPRLDVRAGGLQLALTGGYRREGETWSGKLEGSAPATSLADLAQALPDSVRAKLHAHAVTGRVAITRLVVETPGTGPATTQGELKLTEVAFRGSQTGDLIRIPEAVATLNHPGPASVRGRALSGDAPIDFAVTVQPRENQVLDLTVTAEAGAAALAAFMPPDSKLDLRSGTATVDLHILGAAPFTLENAPLVTGTVSWSGFAGDFDGKPVHEAEGQLIAREHRVELKQCTARVGGSDIGLQGSVADVRTPRLDFTLHSERMNLDELSTPGTAPAPAAAPGMQEPPTLFLIPLRGTVAIGTLITGGMELTGADATVDLGEAGLDAQLRSSSVAGGSATGSVRGAYVPARDVWAYKGTLQTAGVALDKLRPQGFGGIGLDGAMRSTIEFDGDYVLGKSPWPTMNVSADLGVLEGAIRNVPDLAQLGRRLKLAGVSSDRWPFQDLFGFLRVERGNLVVDTLTIRQPGVDWTLAGRLGLAGGSGIRGTARLDPSRVTLPGELAVVAPYLKEPDGRIPVDFTVTGKLPNLSVDLDWDAVVQRAASRAADAEKKKILDALQDAVKDDDRLQKLKKKLGGG